MTNPGQLQDPDTTPDRPTSLSVGDVVADSYRVEALLGEGGMGVVYRAAHVRLHKRFAVKVLLAQWTKMPEVLERFEREAVAASSIQSPNVAAATDSGRMADGSFFIVMEYVDGRTLRSVVEAGALAPARAIRIARGIVSALRAAHAVGIVHRDMKPENVMLVERDGDPDHVKVLDFGIARVAATGTTKLLTRVGAVMGTPDYMSPEQALGQVVDARADLYSVGVMLFEMLTGERPFKGGPITLLQKHVMVEPPVLPVALVATLDPRLDGIVRRLLAKRPEDRFGSAGELLVALEECAGEISPRSAALVPTLDEPLSAIVWTRARNLEKSMRRVLANPETLLDEATPGRIVVAALLVALVPTMFLVLLVGLFGRGSARAAQPTDSAGGAATATESTADASTFPPAPPGGIPRRAPLRPPAGPVSPTNRPRH